MMSRVEKALLAILTGLYQIVQYRIYFFCIDCHTRSPYLDRQQLPGRSWATCGKAEIGLSCLRTLFTHSAIFGMVWHEAHMYAWVRNGKGDSIWLRQLQ